MLTWVVSVAAIVATVLLPLVFLMYRFLPAAAVTASLKLSTRFALAATLVALSAGVLLVRVGSTLATATITVWEALPP